MATPTSITISGKLEIEPGVPDSSATVTFKRREFVRHADGTVIEPGSQVVSVDPDGSFEIVVMASNDPEWIPVGWTYRVAVSTGESIWAFEALVPFDASNGDLTFGELVPALDASAGILYATLNHVHDQYFTAAEIDEVLEDFATLVQVSEAKAEAIAVANGAKARATHTGTQSADTVVDGTTNKVFTATEKTKLSGVATGATANATDAQLRDRSLHTGSQAISTITGLVTAMAAKADLVGGFLASSQIPAIALTTYLGGVANQAAMLALVGQPGDWATRTDTGTTWQITGSTPTQLSSWTQLLTPADAVSSVNGQQGAVNLVKGDVGLGNVDNISAASLRDRSTHTGTQTLATISNAGTAAAKNVGVGADQVIVADAIIPDPTTDHRIVPRRYVMSRGDNLFTNGSGLMQNNYNMSGFTFDRQTHGGAGSFMVNVAQQSRVTDEFIPVDPTKGYRLSVWARSGNDDGTMYSASNRQYIGFAIFDAAFQPMDFAMRSNTNPSAVYTTLAVDLVAGDTTMTLTDATGWNNSATASGRLFSWWPYTDVNGTSFPPYTYSRNLGQNRITGAGLNGVWPAGGIVGNVITLTGPWTGTTLPAGTPVANFGAGGTYLYSALANGVVPNQWTQYSASLLGQNTDRSVSRDGFMLPFGAAYVKLLFLINYHGVANNNVRFSDISFTEHGSIAENVSARGTMVNAAGTIYMLAGYGTLGHLLGTDEGIIYLDCTTGSKVIVLPDPKSGPLNPLEWTFIRTDNTANTITFARPGTTMINGVAANYNGQTAMGSSRRFVHDGTHWWLSGGLGA